MPHSGRFLATSAPHEMTASPHTHALPVHPHQLEVQEFDSYALIADLRATEDFQRDHIPRAVSVPAMNPGSTSVGTSATPIDGPALMAKEGAPDVTYALEAQLATLEPGSAILLYCDQGGALSARVANQLAGRGFEVDVIAGGWGSYRRWVSAGIEVLARSLIWRRLCSSPGGAAQAVLRALAERGEQVLVLGDLVGSCVLPGVVLGAASGSAPSLESRLVDALRRMDPEVRVWGDELVAVSGDQVLPTPIQEAHQHADAWHIDASPECRADLLQRWMAESPVTGTGLVDLLARVLPAAERELVELRKLSTSGREREALVGVLLDVLDPLHRTLSGSGTRAQNDVFELASASQTDIDALAARLA